MSVSFALSRRGVARPGAIMNAVFFVIVLMFLGGLPKASGMSNHTGSELVNAIAKRPELSKFLLSLQSARILARLQGDAAKGVTVLAPTDEAFHELGSDLMTCLLSEPAVNDVMTQILLYHIIPGQVLSFQDLKSPILTFLTTASGLQLPIEYVETRNEVVIDYTAWISRPGAIQATNATVHYISAVLIPPTIEGTLIVECGAQTEQLPAPPSAVPGL
ncbi:hypothetical protein CBR_g12689 [Chara braunii]|uniref:FAS1 domain-containing protein n=1 Tax=Chara braunii TaxID=69332 RepID=A0A388KSC9_CHABU|nr:hypothetical protein CBR_g12689 [Chara braunii]|eukprot:GBG72970.1 hypothetical protein CBR_g12689 [Chara braunii]